MEAWAARQSPVASSGQPAPAESGEGGPAALPIVELFRRPRHDRLSVINTTARGFRTLVTSVDYWYLDFASEWQRRYQFEPLEATTRRPWAPDAVERVPPRLEGLVLGGEAACWGACMASLLTAEHDGSERGGLLSDEFLQATLAVGERLWSPADVRDTACAARRLPMAVEWVRWFVRAGSEEGGRGEI